MIIQRMHHEIKLRYNKLNTNHKKDFPSALIDDVINDVQLVYIDTYYGGNSVKKNKLGFEVTQQRIDMLSTLVEKSEPMLTPQNIEGNVYEFNLSKCKKYRHLIRAYAKTDCGIVNIKMTQHDDLNMVLNQNTKRPSKRWRRLLGVLGSNSTSPSNSSLFVYAEDGWGLEGIYIEYIREPRRVFFGGYDTIEYLSGDLRAYKSSDSSINSELPTQYHSLLVDMAVRELARSIEDVQRFQLRDEKINSM
jgi:hypothetical protein